MGKRRMPDIMQQAGQFKKTKIILPLLLHVVAQCRHDRVRNMTPQIIDANGMNEAIVRRRREERSVSGLVDKAKPLEQWRIDIVINDANWDPHISVDGILNALELRHQAANRISSSQALLSQKA